MIPDKRLIQINVFSVSLGLYVPLKTAQDKMLGVNYITVGVVQLQNINLADATAAEISQTLMHNHNITDPAKDDFVVVTQAQVLGIYNTIFNGITILLIAIASISLVSAGHEGLPCISVRMFSQTYSEGYIL